MPGLPFTQLPKETTPYSVIEEQSRARYGFYQSQEEELKGQMLTDTDYNKGVVGIQKQWDRDKEALAQGKRSLDKIQKLMDEGLITPEAGNEAMWRLVLPGETEAAMFPKEVKAPTGRPFGPGALGSQREFIEAFAAGAPEQPGWEWGPPKRTQPDLMRQYQLAKQQIGYDDPSWTQTQRQQFDMNWDDIMQGHPEYDWNPQSPGVKALRGQGKLQEAAAKQITPLASSVRKEAEKAARRKWARSKWSLGKDFFRVGPAPRAFIEKEMATKTLDRDTAQKIMDEAGGDKKKARELAKQRGYKL